MTGLDTARHTWFHEPKVNLTITVWGKLFVAGATATFRCAILYCIITNEKKLKPEKLVIALIEKYIWLNHEIYNLQISYLKQQSWAPLSCSVWWVWHHPLSTPSLLYPHCEGDGFMPFVLLNRWVSRWLPGYRTAKCCRSWTAWWVLL